jgi:hypothetical protein
MSGNTNEIGDAGVSPGVASAICAFNHIVGSPCNDKFENVKVTATFSIH